VIPVALDRVHDGSRYAGLLEDRLPVLRVSPRVTLVVEVVKQAGDRSGLLVLAVLACETAHRGLHGESVLPKAF